MNNQPTGLTRALTVAYNAVMALGFTHQRLVDEKHGVNYNTLRRIRDGKPGKLVTDRYFLQLFVSILEENYKKCRENADTQGKNAILRTMRKILVFELEIPTD